MADSPKKKTPSRKSTGVSKSNVSRGTARKTTVKKAVKSSSTKAVGGQKSKTSQVKKAATSEQIKKEIPLSEGNSFLKRFSEQLDKNVAMLNKKMPPVKNKVLMKPATLFGRLAAFITDFMIIDLIIFSWFNKYIVTLAPEGSLSMRNIFLDPTALAYSEHLVLIGSLLLFLTFAYFVFFEYKFGQTPGKMLFRLKVISSKPLLERIKQYKVDINSVTQKIIDSEGKTVDIHEELKKEHAPKQQTPDSFGLSIWQALGRSLYFIPIIPFILIAPIDIIFLILKQRRLSDSFTKTTVVETIPVKRLEKLNNLMKKYFNNN